MYRRTATVDCSTPDRTATTGNEQTMIVVSQMMIREVRFTLRWISYKSKFKISEKEVKRETERNFKSDIKRECSIGRWRESWREREGKR
jgi:hypothetical protein